jgi:predicted secreted protein
MIARWAILGNLALAAFPLAAQGQQPFALDPTFRAQFNDWYVSSILPLEDGDVILSGQIKFAGDQYFRTGVRLNTDGTRNLSFANVTYMGGKLTEWNGKVYAQNGIGVRRLFFDGLLDNTFSMVSAPYFSALQGGDYHVYPDGSLLISGAHSVNLPDSGWSGLHNLIWFTNTGRLDTTRAPRKGNGVIYRIKELPDGKFMCTGPMTVFEGQPTSYIFRVHADGMLDTTFYTGVFWGQAFAYLPLADGRCYVGGLFRTPESGFNKRLVRFLADGSLDPTFNNELHFDQGILSGLDGIVSTINFLSNGDLLVTGSFQAVDGIPHNGICIVDSTGQVVPQLQGQGCGSYVYQTQNSSTTYGTIDGVHFMPDNMMYIWGAYHGYSDGTTNDPLQRFVTRLYGPDFSTQLVEEQVDKPVLRLAPNPAQSWVAISWQVENGSAGSVELRDMMGRPVQRLTAVGGQGQLLWECHAVPAGAYTVSLVNEHGDQLAVERLIIQP